ncbi:hypothetical protein [Butyricimonas synergistica]|uniref:hypothetical protein n=1 Tax=Butyricimonas synergistica TaxID=544644 RepID=UPI00036C56ED|nr:hypothetical protein [Butyricimonas synergistica]
MKIFKSIIINGVCVCISLIFFAREIFPLVLYVIITAISFVFLFLSLAFDIVPYIFSHREKRKEDNKLVLMPRMKWLLFITKDMGKTIRNLYIIIMLIVFYFYIYENEIPRIVSYLYWLIFGAYFGIKILCYSNFYQKKYNSKEIENNYSSRE